MSSTQPAAALVAVALPVQGLFHYRVPPDLDEKTVPGMRVLVPFGRRMVTGYVLERGRPEGYDGRLKDIASLLDDEPLFSPSMIPFFRFASEYYHYPLGMVVSEALPAGLKVMSRKTARLTEAGRRACRDGSADAAQAELLSSLDRPRGRPLSGLEKKHSAGLIRACREKGWVEVEADLNRERVGPKLEKWLSPLPTPGSERLGPREAELLARLEARGPTPASELRPEFPSLAAMTRRLVEKGRLEVEERLVYRDSLGRALLFDHQKPVPTPEQEAANRALAEALDRQEFSCFVLRGVTGSGKTEVYLAAVEHVLNQGRTALLLVPEISLTPALEGLLKARFREESAVMHSGLPDGERYDQWRKIRRKKVRLVLGARSAVFAPLDDLGLIVVDEEHDGAYKQEDKLRYQARDLAVLRAKQSRAVALLGSATPSLESFQAAQSGRYRLLTLDKRIDQGRGDQGRLPQVDVVDLRFDSGRRRGALTPMLKKALTETLDQGRQALLFINRRGLAGLPMCLSCGHVEKCVNCSVTLTLHQGLTNKSDQRLNCHYCGFELPPPGRCPKCGSRLFRYMGLGTEKLEEEVKKAFPEARIARLDADTARPKGELTRILTQLRDHELDILVGTQMIAKGHDFPGITLVGVIEADQGLHLPDFRAGERTFQLLAQVSGRAGRGRDPGRVIVQTLSPEHYTLLLAKRHDFLGFFEAEIDQRRQLGYPPFRRLVMIRLQGGSESRTSAAARDAARIAREMLDAGLGRGVEIMGPAPAPLAKVKGKFRFQILLRGEAVGSLHSFLDAWLAEIEPRLKKEAVSLAVDVDPHQML